MNEILPTLVAILVGVVIVLARRGRYSEAEFQLIVASFLLHLVSVYAQVWITWEYYRLGDMISYHRAGLRLSYALSTNFTVFFPKIVTLIFQGEPHLPMTVVGIGTSSTATMAGLTTLLLFITRDSLYATCVLISLASLSGKLAIYQVFKETWPARYHLRLLGAAALVPSVVFWSAAITKEAFALAGLGFMLLGMHRAIGGRYGVGLPMLFAGAVLVGLVKPYVLFVFFIAAALWLYWARAIARTGTVQIKPLRLLVAGGFAVVAVLILGSLFPRFALTSLGESVASQQQYARTETNESNYTMGDASKRSLGQQMAYAPFALLTALVRPSMLEVRNVPMFVNAVETTVITFLLLQAGYYRRGGWMWRTVARSPIGMFCLVFTLIFGIGVGLGTTNLGTLSRYRMPLMPFYTALVLIWSAPPPARRRDAVTGAVIDVASTPAKPASPRPPRRIPPKPPPRRQPAHRVTVAAPGKVGPAEGQP